MSSTIRSCGLYGADLLAVAHGAEKIATDRGGIDHGRIEFECDILATCARLAAIGESGFAVPHQPR